MKKFISLILLSIMIICLTACGSEPANPPAETNAAIEGTVGTTTLDTYLWELKYDESVWKYEEDNLSDDESYSSVDMIIPKDDSYTVSASICSAVEDPGNFRDYLNSYGFDDYEYAENNAYDLVKIGGVDCLKQEGNYWGEPCLRYFGRVENAGTTVKIEICGDYEDQRVADLLAGLNFKITDIGNVDYPWPWNGEPFSAENKTVSAGSKTLSSQWIPFEESFITNETFEHAVATVGSDIYILSDGVLKQYKLENDKLAFVKDIELDGEYKYISAANDGSLWLSSFSDGLVNVKDGAIVASFDDTDYVAMSPDGKWGINWFSSSECEKITVSGDSLSREAINFPEVDTVSELMVDDEYIYVCGYAADDSGFKVYIYDTEGKLKLTLTDEDGESLGSISFIAKTSDGFIGLDGNMRDVMLWNNDGSFAGLAGDDELFSTNYPWFCGGTLTDDGNMLLVMTDDRTDESAMELIAFELSLK